MPTHARMNKDAPMLQAKTHSSLDKLICQLTAKQPYNATLKLDNLTMQRHERKKENDGQMKETLP